MSYAPPSYTDAPGAGPSTPSTPTKYHSTDVAAPLLGQQAALRPASPGSDAGSEEDFKIGTSVASSDVSIRLAFIRKVYTILTVQILFTCIVSFVMAQPFAVSWTQQNSWFMWIPMIGSFASLFTLMWKADSFPLNLIILGVFTLFESVLVGTVVSFYETTAVLQALAITLAVFIGLTAFTMQSKYDFDGMGPWLFSGLMVLVATSFIGIFFPFGKTTDLIIAVASSLIFSGYIIFDTHAVCKKLSPDEYVMGALRLYLDVLNLFLSILRVIGNSQRD